jgi:uncharacterized repeat protein (TIGR01451 family)
MNTSRSALRGLVRLVLALVLLLPASSRLWAAVLGPLTPLGIPELAAYDATFFRLRSVASVSHPSHVDMSFAVPAGSPETVLAARLDVYAKRAGGSPALAVADPDTDDVLTEELVGWDAYHPELRHVESWWAPNDALGSYVAATTVPGSPTTLRAQLTQQDAVTALLDIDRVQLTLYTAAETAAPPLHAGCQAANIDLIVDNSAALGSSNVVALRDAIADLVEGVEAVLPETHWRVTTYHTSALNNSVPLIATGSWQASLSAADLAAMTSSGLSPLADSIAHAVSAPGPDAAQRDTIMIVITAGPPNVAAAGNGSTPYERMYGVAAVDAVQAANAARDAGWSTLVVSIGTNHPDLASTFVDGVHRGLAGTDVDGPAGDVIGARLDTMADDLVALLTDACNGDMAMEALAPDLVLAGETATYTYRLTNTGHVPLHGVGIVDTPCGSASYVSGDANGDETLDLDETWVFACSHAPTFAPAAPLHHVAKGLAWHGHTAVTVQDDCTLFPLRLTKDVYRYWSAAHALQYERTNASFDVQVHQGSDLLGTVSVIDADEPTDIWLGEGTYTLCEVPPPAEYAAASGCITLQGSQRIERWDIANAIHHDLAVTAAGPACAIPGQSITYALALTNAGPASVAPSLTATVGGALHTPTYEGGDTDGDGKMDPGEEWRYRLAATLTDDAAGHVPGTAVAADGDRPAEGGPYVGGDSHPSDNTATWNVAVVRPALAIAMAPAEQSLVVGGSAAFAVTVTNTGDTPLHHVAVSAPVAPDCSRTRAELSPGDAWQYACTRADVRASQTVTATAAATSCAGAVHAVTSAEVTVELRPLALSSECWEDNATHRWRVHNPNPVDVAFAWESVDSDLQGAGTAPAGGDAVFTTTGAAPDDGSTVRLFVGNALQATGTAVTDWCTPHGTLTVDKTVDWNGVTPEAAAFVICLQGPGDTAGLSASPAATACQTVSGAGGAVTWRYLLPGTYTVSEQDPGDAWERIGSPATVRLIGGGTTRHTITNRRVLRPAVTLAASADPTVSAPHGAVRYTLVYTNTGTMDLTGVTITADPNETYIATIGAISDDGAYDGGTITWSLGPLAAGATGSVRYEATLQGDDTFAVDVPTSIVSMATITSTEGAAAQAQATVTVTRLLTPAPALTLTKVGSTTVAKPGDTVDYTITVKNIGDVTLTNVTVVDAKLGINANVGDLAPGASAQVTGSYTVTEADLDGIVNTATADSDQTDTVADTWTVEVAMQPGLVLEKTASTEVAAIGETITFTLRVTNVGDVPLTDVTLRDPRLGIEHLIGDLAIGESATMEVPYTVTAEDAPAIHNVATVTGKDPAGHTLTDTAEATVALERPLEQPPTPIPCTRADVAVVLFGGWNGIPVKAWVGGTEQETLTSAVDAFGQQQVMWTFYPPEGTSWNVSVQPQTPEGFDPARWQYELVRIESPSLGTENNHPSSPTLSIRRCNQYVLYFQLVDRGAAP